MTQHEFQRQLRNLFAMLRTLVRQTTEGRISVEDYAAHLEGRIGALARVHELLMRAPQEGADLHELVSGELLAQAIAEDRFHLGGSEVRIASESVVALALTFHELTVNALTHGAFSTTAGRAEISWRIESEMSQPWLHFEWQELGVPLKKDPWDTKGFGSEVLERMLPYELNARTSCGATDEGIRVILRIPASAVGAIWRPLALKRVSGSGV
jgi:two-component system CheB/CheR fusion protein